MRRYENWLVAVIFVALLVLFALALDVRRDITSLKRDAAYNAASGRESPGPDIFLEERIRCLEAQQRVLSGQAIPRC